MRKGFALKILISLVILLALTSACDASTFKPFIRSRYSQRWRRTTESPVTLLDKSNVTTESVQAKNPEEHVVLSTTASPAVTTSSNEKVKIQPPTTMVPTTSMHMERKSILTSLTDMRTSTSKPTRDKHHHFNMVEYDYYETGENGEMQVK